HAVADASHRGNGRRAEARRVSFAIDAQSGLEAIGNARDRRQYASFRRLRELLDVAWAPARSPTRPPDARRRVRAPSVPLPTRSSCALEEVRQAIPALPRTNDQHLHSRAERFASLMRPG